MRFDPEASRQNLRSYLLKMYRDLSYEESFNQRTLGSWGCGAISTAVECGLVGLFSEADKLIKQAHMFLQGADQGSEQNNVGKGIVLAELALTSWFLNRTTDAESLQRCVGWREAWFATQKMMPDRVNIQLSLAPYLEAESYELLIARYESAGLKKPANIRRIQGEGTMCYVMARHRLGLEYTDEEIAAALETFLKRSVKEWLGRDGSYTSAARWMKIAHWHPSDDPIATLLRCYDYLPGLKPPTYPPKK